MIEAEVTFWKSLVDTNGTALKAPWYQLFAKLSEWRPFAGEKEQPGWSAAVFSPCVRGLANVKAVSALVLDYDGTCSIDSAIEHWTGTRGLLHTTRKHTQDVHRFRVVLPFSRLVTPSEYEKIWAYVYAQTGDKLDPAPKDPSRFWFLPGSDRQTDFRAPWIEGEPFNVDAVLKLSLPKPTVDYRPDTDLNVRRASAYLAKMPSAVSGAKGHDALWAATLAVVCGFNLSANQTFGLLSREYNPRCQPPWREKELWHKIDQALTKSKVPDGYLKDEKRDHRPTPSSLPVADPEDDGRLPGHKGTEKAVSSPGTTYGVRSMAELLNGAYTRASTELPDPGGCSGVELIDAAMGGFQRGSVTIIGAPTSWGKSSFAILTAEKSREAGKRVLLVSAEDSEITYGRRFMSRRSQVNAISIRDCRCSTADFDRMATALGKAEQDPFFLNAIGKSAEWIAEAVTKLCATRDYDLVLLDYLQAFKCDKRCQDRRVEMTHIARTLIDAVKNANVAGLLFSQLRRLANGEHPSMNHLKESGDLECFAENVLIGSIDVVEKPNQLPDWHRKMAICKSKDGVVYPSPFELEFDPNTASFTGRSDARNPGSFQ